VSTCQSMLRHVLGRCRGAGVPAGYVL
jgi:hypothetical protein